MVFILVFFFKEVKNLMKKLQILYVGVDVGRHASSDSGCSKTLASRLLLLYDNLGYADYKVLNIGSRWTNTRRLNAEIIEKASNFSPSVVWIDKGRSIFASTIKKLRNEFGILCVHYTADKLLQFILAGISIKR